MIDFTRVVGPVGRAFAAVMVAGLAAAAPAGAQPSFVNFESGQVRPLVLSADGTRLYALNTPDNRLEIFDVDTGGITHAASVPVGMEPVALAERTSTELWVVNHLSDSVSIVDVGATPPRVTRTLLVGDEPRDIVFAGTGGNRAFITTAHRGQQRTHPSIAGVPGAGDPQFTTAGVDRADVWVFDAASLGATLGGTPIRILTFFTDTPRALAKSPSGDVVYVAGFHTGNQTTAVTEGAVCNGFAGAGACGVDGISSPGGLPGAQVPGGNPGPSTNVQGITAPEVGLIVKFNPATGKWEDELGRNWNNAVRFHLPDEDVFAVDANTLAQVAVHPTVGTTLFNMIVNPANGDLYVTNTDAQNHVRFEGPGIVGGSTVQGHLAEARITVIDSPALTDPSGLSIKPRHLNKHIDYATLAGEPGFDATAKLHSLATPLDMAIDSFGTVLYVAAFGSSRVGVFDVSTLENDTFDPTLASGSYLDVSGGGPSGLALDEDNDRLYVLTRFDNAVSVIDLSTGAETDHVELPNPEPTDVREGRPFLYDAFETSANGETSCASCHVFGDLDQLGWDLGNPDDHVTDNPMTIKLSIAAGGSVNGGADVDQFHPMKGPMTTQTLRGMQNSGPMHWRGDRADGFFGQGLDEALSFNNFIVAFEGLVGRASMPSAADMQKFTDFALSLMLPPNPVRAIDNSLTTDQQGGRNFYLGSRFADGINISGFGFNCNGCHTLNPSQGFFGTNGDASFENEEQIIKIAHLRNLYQKVGMFGMPDVDFVNGGDNGHKGDQIRGFGYLHDGSIDTLFRFFQATVFNNSNGVGFDGPNNGDDKRRQMEQFMLAFDSDLAPVVGQQVTLTSTNSAVVGPRITTLVARAQAPFVSKELGGNVTECDLVVKGTVAGEERGWVLIGSTFVSDRASEPALSDASLRALAATPGQELTYTCAPPGSGVRMGIDRDEDTYLDRDELDSGSDPGDPGSIPGACGNGAVDPGESCDSANLAGQTCGSLGFDGGTLACTGACQFDTSGCFDCGDGVVDVGEDCDGVDLDGETCLTQGYDGGTLACSATCQFDASGCYECGDGGVDPGESCDGANLGGQTCATQGFDGGTLACTGSCQLDTSGCFACGDGSIDPGESCDGANLGGETCLTRGYDGGTLGCSAGCGFDESGCFLNTCGDGDVDAGEDCDGVDLGGATCASEGFDGGTLGCTGTCHFDTSGCFACGDGNVDPGESCDGSNLDGETCVSQGFDGGTLGCDAGCGFDTSACYECGDGNVDPGESCDGANLDGETCVTQGFDTGTLACDASCGFDTGGCANIVCGDGSIGAGEECDGSELGGETCESQGFFSGTLACDGSCGLDTAGCVSLRGAYVNRMLKVARLTKPAGTQKISLKSLDMNGAGATYNTIEEPFTITIDDGVQTLFSATVPAGDPDWRLKGDWLRWKAKTAPHPDGLKSVAIGLAGQPFAVKLNVGATSISGVAGGVGLNVTIVVGNDAWSGATAACVLSGSGATLKCKE